MPGAVIKDESSYNASYYQQHKEKILAARAQRYRTDPEYREKTMHAAIERKKRLRAEAIPKPRKKLGLESVTHLIQIGDQDVEVEMFTSGQLARFMDRTIQTIRLWEKNGILPKALYRTSSGSRLYTALQVQELVKALASAKRGDGVSLVRERISSTSFPARAEEIWKKYPNGVSSAEGV